MTDQELIEIRDQFEDAFLDIFLSRQGEFAAMDATVIQKQWLMHQLASSFNDVALKLRQAAIE